ncbi:CLUMA_CG001936, isoform A [Clunio marinus]|uniref:CLUMA_CG001936, isoform A n=1 Tax=Clunio marinus TaxID=568069 RepID=A0A1J1HJE4_9DIPT|nr:CLUMA_CG001936, isoform A [Clunio marinus]
MLKLFSSILLLILTFNVIETSSVSDELCDRQLNYFDEALNRRDSWAVFVFDTWAKFQSSILRGNLVIPGGFIDCVTFRHQSERADIGTFQGQHCMVRFSAKTEAAEIDRENGFDWREIGAIARENNYNFRHGFCLPASCSSEKVLNYMRTYLSQADFNVTEAECQTNDPLKYEIIDIIAIVIFSIFGLLMVLSTIYEIITIRNDRVPHELYASFSVYTNGWKLYNVSVSKSSDDIRCLHGIRALSIIYIIFGHRYGLPMWNVISNRAAIADWQQNFHIGIYHTHQVAVDVFFTMGGLLVTWSMMKSLDSNRLSILRLYFRRYLRYTPLLGVLMLFVISLMRHIVFGPISYMDGGFWPFLTNCNNWWWTTLLHLQNYVNPNEICMSHTWYLSIDFQLFLVSPFLIYPAWRYGWKYLWTLPTLALLSSIYIFIMSMVFNIYMVTKSPDAAPFEFFIQWIYYPTHARMGPWFIGMTLGYILYQNRHKRVRLDPFVNVVMWILCLSLFTAITMGSQYMFLPPHVNTTTLLENAFYLAFYRNGWSLATAWMIFACHNGTGGFIRWFLQLPQWQPIARMGLSMYLLGFIFQHFQIMHQKQPTYFDEFDLIHLFLGDLLASIFISTVGYLAFEVPILTVENYVHNKIRGKKIQVTKM